MRLYVSILAAAGLFTVSACGKKAEPQPEPVKTEEPKKEEPKAEEPKKEEPKAEEPKAEEPKAEEPKAEVPAAPADRTEGVQKALEAWSTGDMDAAYAHYTDDVVLYNVGNPQMPEVKGKAAVVEMAKSMKSTMTELKVKASRIIEAGEVQVVEYVIQGQFKAPGDEAAPAKTITVPAAMVLAYNAEGKVAQAWNFQDDASALQQIGAIPGLPEGFAPVAFPEATEVVKGEKNDALAAIYKDFGAKMSSAETIDSIADLLAEDYTMVDFSSGKTIAKADTVAFLKAWSGMFADKTNTIDKEFSVGEFYITVSTMTGTYKGGIPNVEAKDQKVTITSLDISRIVDGKFKSWAGYSNNMQILSSLGVLGGAAEKPAEGEAAAAGDIGVAECDNYLKTVRECMGKLPEQAQAQFETGIKSALDSWKQLAAGGDEAKAALAQACKQAVEASKQAMGTMCPDVKWE
jgi:steroid delta-isomerase-like uncharacterized protein